MTTNIIHERRKISSLHFHREIDFDIPVERHMGMVVFRLKGENEMTEKLLKRLNGSGKMLTKHKNM